MQYIGLQTQIWRNNLKSIILLIAFPLLILSLVLAFFLIISPYSDYKQHALKNAKKQNITLEETQIKQRYINTIKSEYLQTIPWISLGVLTWFFIAYFSHSSLIAKATGAKPLERKKNKRVYNLVENLCISQGMQTPQIKIIDDTSLNAFASGINQETYTINLSKGIINKLNDQELETVIGHELTHIRNRDVRLLIISIIFVGIFAFISEMAFRSLRYSSHSRSKKGSGGAIFVILFLAIIGYILSLIFRFALSRKREFLADAGSVMLTHHPEALASALEKISHDSEIEAVKRKDVAQLFIENPQSQSTKLLAFFPKIFATHPPIEERISLLKQY